MRDETQLADIFPNIYLIVKPITIDMVANTIKTATAACDV